MTEASWRLGGLWAFGTSGLRDELPPPNTSNRPPRPIAHAPTLTSLALFVVWAPPSIYESQVYPRRKKSAKKSHNPPEVAFRRPHSLGSPTGVFHRRLHACVICMTYFLDLRPNPETRAFRRRCRTPQKIPPLPFPRWMCRNWARRGLVSTSGPRGRWITAARRPHPGPVCGAAWPCHAAIGHRLSEPLCWEPRAMRLLGLAMHWGHVSPACLGVGGGFVYY